MRFKFNIRRELKIAIAVIVFFGIIAFTERMQGTVSVKDVVIKIENIENNHFIDEEDVLDLMQITGENLRGASIGQLNLKEIENRIKSDAFVKDAELYSDIKGNLVVNVELRRPIARIVRSYGPSVYIAEDGAIMPISEKFSVRTLLISGSHANQIMHEENILKSEGGEDLFYMINLIRNDEFWKAQIAQIDITSINNTTLYPQIGGQLIEFGKLENIDVKFSKLKVFYKEILPQKGWNTYHRVNLEYEGQIITE
jgi:cell division protein FtsQ